MRIPLHIKGEKLWKVCAFIILAIILACCGEEIASVDQPSTAKVGSTVPITVNINIPTQGDGGPDYLIFGFLVPKGWQTSKNATITYSGPRGSGNMTLIPTTTLAKNGGGLNWPDYMKKTFGIGANLIDDMEWVAYQSDKSFTHGGNETITGKLNIQIKVGADNNNTLVKLGYCISDTGNGFTSNEFGTYYSVKLMTDCFELTGGTGDMVDFCNPQLTTVNPPKSLDNDFVTLTFDGTVAATQLSGAQNVYLCATAYTNDGKTVTVCEQTDKTRMVQLPAGSKKYQITFWPKSFFGVTDAQTIVKMEYFINSADGATKVGYGNTSSPFVYTFKCT
ncbi:DUF4961 domain-containing protein [Mucilaginibacter sp. Bleaf8]|uniref:DUF4961 domain-containing protein n=1 Tax=Mucilaginibacter sp. Bleaf8 TaxID=2834430 RepID=UPI001BD069F3|nr:DUF4961 domain-containing protein [Mucilaginibacter sp. Bleaf8]MBS7564734.1 DUF4961 domain-containing protein [Mucilaginibacter sp. Bleaf8]